MRGDLGVWRDGERERERVEKGSLTDSVHTFPVHHSDVGSICKVVIVPNTKLEVVGSRRACALVNMETFDL